MAAILPDVVRQVQLLGSPWENTYYTSPNGKLRVECLNGEIFYGSRGTQIIIERRSTITTLSTRSGSRLPGRVLASTTQNPA